MSVDCEAVNQVPSCEAREHSVVVCVSSAPAYRERRDAIRQSYFKLLSRRDPAGIGEHSLLSHRFHIRFVLGRLREEERESIHSEMQQYNDIALVDCEDSYDALSQKLVAYMAAVSSAGQHDGVEQRDGEAQRAPRQYPVEDAARYFVHADDDTFLRLDALSLAIQELPPQRVCAGYIWDNKERKTAPLRDNTAKSYMPEAQYPGTRYPSFASGCCFVLSWDVLERVVAARDSLPHVRLIDVALGIFIDLLYCGGAESQLPEVVLEKWRASHCASPSAPCEPLSFVHWDTVRPYRGLPLFHEGVVAQHYMNAIEFPTYYHHVVEAIERGERGESAPQPSGAAAGLYARLVDMGLMRR